MIKMDLNKLLIPIFLVAVIIIGDIFIFWLSNMNNNANIKLDSTFQGVGEVKLKLVNYKKTLKVSPPLEEGELEKIKPYIYKYQTLGNNTIIFVNNTSDVTVVARLLREKDVRALATFSPLALNYENGTLNISFPVELEIEPLFPLGTVLEANVQFIARGNEVIALGSISDFNVARKPITVSAELKNITNIYYKYIIDFENRSKIEPFVKEHNKTIIEYKISNIVFTDNNLFYKAPYVKYIGDGYIEVDSNFTNRTRIEKDYKNVVFEDSFIIANSPLEDLDFAKDYDVIYEAEYKIVSDYVFLDDVLILNVTEPLNTTNISLYTTIVGNTVIDYEVFE